MSFSGLAQGFLRQTPDGGFAFTRKGMEELETMLKVGSSLNECADFFCIDEDFIKASTEAGGQCYELFRHCTAHFKREVRKAQLKLADENAMMAKHLGAHALGQPVNPTPADPSLTEKVVGTFPDWKAPSDDWAAKHKPTKQSAGTIEQLQAMAAKQQAEDDANDELYRAEEDGQAETADAEAEPEQADMGF